MVNQRLEAPTVLALEDIVQLTPTVQQAFSSVAILAISLAWGALLAELLRDEFFAAVDFFGSSRTLGDFRCANASGITRNCGMWQNATV